MLSRKCLLLRKFLLASAIPLQLALCAASKSGKQPFRVFVNYDCLTQEEKAELYAGSANSDDVNSSLSPSSSRNNNMFSNSPPDGEYMVYGQSTSNESSTSLSPPSSRRKKQGVLYEFHDENRIEQQYEIPDRYDSSANMFDNWDTEHDKFAPSGKPTPRKATETSTGEISSAWGDVFSSSKTSAPTSRTLASRPLESAPSHMPIATRTNKQSDGSRHSASTAASSPAGKSWKVRCASKVNTNSLLFQLFQHGSDI